MIPPPAISLPAPGLSGLRIIFRNAESGPSTAARMPTAAQESRTAACECRRQGSLLVYELPQAVPMPGTRPKSCPMVSNILHSAHTSTGKRARNTGFSGGTGSFFNMYKFPEQISPAGSTVSGPAVRCRTVSAAKKETPDSSKEPGRRSFPLTLTGKRGRFNARFCAGRCAGPEQPGSKRSCFSSPGGR